MLDIFILAVKSTLDRAGKQLSDSFGVTEFVDLDDTVNVSSALTGESTVVVWKFNELIEDPIDPLYVMSFSIGIKTTTDPGRYSLLDFVSKVKMTFAVGDSLQVLNWSQQATPTTPLGVIHFTESGVEQQVSDKLSGIRMLSVEARVSRLI